MSSTSHKLLISLLPESLKHLKALVSGPEHSHMIEVRYDKIGAVRPAAVRKLIANPLVGTVRTAADGGFWDGSDDDKLKLLKAMNRAGFEYLDIELENAASLLAKVAGSGSAKIILSCHTSQNDPASLREILERMFARHADVYKLVFHAASFADNRTAVALMEAASAAGKRFVIHASGEDGQLSRLLGPVYGNEWTYVARNFEETTAPGQISLDVARYYNLGDKSRETRIIGLSGYPLQQSKGWRLHNRLISLTAPDEFSSEEHDYLYVNFPSNNFEQFWEDWQEKIHGVSVTLPHKEKVMSFITDMTPEVRISGVCNTLVRDEDGWKGHNTDMLAIEALLRPHEIRRKGGALIIGTGATARSAIAVMKRMEVNPIFVSGRNLKRGEMLLSLFGIDYLEDSEIHYAGAATVIQTTPVGMVPYVDQYPIGTSHFRRDRVVLDVVYNPEETRFLKIAKDRGCVTISGAEMFILQAAKQFELFTGRTMTLEQVREVWNEVN